MVARGLFLSEKEGEVECCKGCSGVLVIVTAISREGSVVTGVVSIGVDFESMVSCL
jgi:hypothetical protein